MARTIRITRDGDTWMATINGARVSIADAGEFEVHDSGDGRFVVNGPSGQVTAFAAASGEDVWVGVAGAVLDLTAGRDGDGGRTGARDQDALSPPMPATVVRVAVKVGDAVKKGDLLVALEAMKMELPIRAPRDGVVSAVRCRDGELVPAGRAVIELE